MELAKESRGGFYPYSMNGGTTLGLTGEDFAIVASDTRLCEEDYYLIHSRDHPHLYQLGSKTFLASTGFQGDVATLLKVLHSRVKMYRYDHNKEISTSALAAMLSVTLYYKRFFPYYASCMVVGLDDEGKGALYSYDVVGSYEREKYRAGGSSSAILQPFLDSQIGGLNQGGRKQPLGKEEAIKLVRDIFISAAERDIHCGDAVLIKVITKEGVEEHKFPLRRD